MRAPGQLLLAWPLVQAPYQKILSYMTIIIVIVMIIVIIMMKIMNIVMIVMVIGHYDDHD